MNAASFKRYVNLAKRTSINAVAAAGCDVTLPNGTVIKAIPDEDPEAISRALDARPLDDNPKGRPTLFSFAPGTLPPNSRFIIYEGQRWALEPARAYAAANDKVLVVMLGFAGAIGGTFED